MNNKSVAFWFFMLGLGCATKLHLVGFIGISQVVAFVVAPFLLLQNMGALKRDGFMTFINLSLLSVAGCVISSWYNETEISLALRGVALIYTRIATVVVFYHLLKKDAAAVRWFFVGMAISQVITIWGFREGNEAYQVFTRGDDMLQDRALFFMQHFGGLFTLPLFAFFLQTPVLISLGMCCYPGLRTMLISSSGRSAVMLLAMTAVMVLFAGRRPSRMSGIKKHFVVIMAVTALCGLGFASLYKFLGQTGRLNEAAQQKYESQMENAKGGILGKIMAGRAEFFIGMFAVADNPIFGCGPWPIDKKGYAVQFLNKYGSWEDVQKFHAHARFRASIGLRDSIIPLHSELISCWVYNSILGVPVILYTLWLIFTVLRKHIDAVPQWYGFYAMCIPAALWGIFFSPPGNGIDPLVAMLLYSLAVGRGKIRLPEKMYLEAAKRDS